MSLPARMTRSLLFSFVCMVVFFAEPALAQQVPESAAVPDAPSARVATETKTPAPPSRPGGAKNNLSDFGHQFMSPWTFILPAFTAGISTATSDDHAFDSGGRGYGERYGVFLADNVDAKFMRSFVMPTIFNQVEGYHPVGPDQRVSKRFGHAFAHTFVSKTRNGNTTFNMSGVPASFAIASVGNLYYPGKYSNTWHMVQRAAWMQAGYFGLDVWREFRPQICPKLHLPCGREHQ